MSQRINVVVTDEQHALLMAMAKLQGRSAASYLREMLDAATPLLLASLPLLRASVEGLDVHSAALARSSALFCDALEKVQPLVDSASDGIAEALDVLQAREEVEGTPDASAGRRAAPLHPGASSSANAS